MGVTQDQIAKLQRRFEMRRRPAFCHPNIADCAKQLAKSARKDNRVLNAVYECWRQHADDLLPSVQEFSYAREVLTVKIKSAAARFDLDRRWRSDLRALTVACTPGTIRRLKIVQSR